MPAPRLAAIALLASTILWTNICIADPLVKVPKVGEQTRDDMQAKGMNIPRTRARGLAITGHVTSGAGFLTMLGGALAASWNPDTGTVVYFAGGGLISVGSIMATSAYTVRQRAYASAGYPVGIKPLVAGWVLTATTLGLNTAGLITMSIGGFSMEDKSIDGLGYFLCAAAMVGASFWLELINAIWTRGAWRRAFKRAEPEDPKISFSPVVYPYRVKAEKKAVMWGVGVNALF